MNIYDISNKTGYSIATVSRVINGKGTVKKATAEAILRAIDEMGYTPNIFAQGLGHNSIKTIGVMCANATDLYLAAAVTTMERELRVHQYDSLLCNTGYEQENKEKYLGLLLAKRVDAVILIGSQFISGESNAYIKNAAKSTPIIIVNGAMDGDNIYCTACADRDATYNTTLSLIEAGHTRILFCRDSSTYSSSEKVRGFVEAMGESGLPGGNASVVNFSRDINAAETLAGEYLDRYPDVTCAFCTDDLIAVGVLKSAIRRGLRVPEDFSVVGYNNSILALCTTPRLTSIDTKVEQLCKSAAKTVTDILSGEAAPQKTLINAELIERESAKITPWRDFR